MSDREELEALRRMAELEKREAKPLQLGPAGMGESMKQVMKEQGPLASRAAAFASFPRQLYEGGKQVLGMGDESNIRAVRAMESEYPGTAIAGGVASMVPLSRIPGLGTVAGQAVQGSITGALMPTLGDESWLKNATLGGVLSGGLAAGFKGAGMLVGKLFDKSTTQAASEAAKQSVRDSTIKEAQAAGYVIPPSATGGGATAKILESLGGKAAVGQEASIRNQQVTNELARKAASLKPDEPITEATLKAARDALAEPYRQVASVSNIAAKALEKLQEARLDAKDLWRQYGAGNAGPEVRKAAQAADSQVSMLERVIEKEASKVGQSGLVETLRQARVAIAKNFNVEKALNVGDGNVDAHVIGRLLDKVGVNGITGELQTIGKFAQAFSPFARHAPVTQSAPDVSKLTPYVAAGLGMGGMAASDRLGMGPWGMAAAGLPFLSSGARNIALSRLMQTAPSYGPSTGLRLADFAARQIGTAAAVPGAMTLEQIANQ